MDVIYHDRELSLRPDAANYWLCSAADGGVMLREAKRRIARCDHANAVLRKLEVVIAAMLNAGVVAVPIDSVSRRQRYHAVAVETLHDHTAPRLGLVDCDGGHHVYVFPFKAARLCTC